MNHAGPFVGLPTYFQVTKWLHKDSSEYLNVSQPERCLHKSLKLGTHYHVDLTFLYFFSKNRMAHLISIWSRISLLVETNCPLSNCWIVVTRRSDRSSVSICSYNVPKLNLTFLAVFPLKQFLQTVPLWVFNEDLSWVSADIW